MGPFRYPQGAQKGPFGPKQTLELLSAPEEADLVPTSADWSDWVEIMVTTHFGLVSGLFWAPRDSKRARFGPKCPFWRAQKGPNSKLSQTYRVTYQNLRKKTTRPMEKTLP